MFHQLAILSIRKETPDSMSVAFVIPDHLKQAFHFLPGQNLTLKTNINNEEIRRSYSICSTPGSGELRVAIKQTPGGLFSTWAISNLKPGSIIDVMPPTGRFGKYTQQQTARKYLAIAAGSGITPIFSIISHKLKLEPGCDVTLLYGNRTRTSIIFRDAISDLKNQYINRFAVHHVLSRELPDAEIYSGRIDAEKCENLSDQLIDFTGMDEVYICGPEAMIFELRSWLLSKNIDQSKIHFELFSTATDNPTSSKKTGNSAEENSQSSLTINASQPASCQVTIKLDGISFSFDLAPDSESILEASLDQGADLPFSCKGGVCGTCRAKLIRGQVEMELNYALEPEEVEAGYILTCQSRPLTDQVSIDFDHK